ncbi:MAG TPA: hypothetical protein IGS17_21690 [Oscillatoriales cyanobacterium M59_W2019_021]|nr:hypothetical protein [Oscillatoriales cyanobacterium M4454_W2019_049]HIK53503.1 hypothetical protein [Oscillatoriales cyanobacterium M59_W2019_021]
MAIAAKIPRIIVITNSSIAVYPADDDFGLSIEGIDWQPLIVLIDAPVPVFLDRLGLLSHRTFHPTQTFLGDWQPPFLVGMSSGGKFATEFPVLQGIVPASSRFFQLRQEAVGR